MRHGSHSSGPVQQESTRRDVLKWSGKLAAASALTGISIPMVHAGGDDTIRLALIGCGGRGSGAVANAFDSPHGPVKLVAMADLFENRLAAAQKALSGRYSDKIDVPPDRRFVGFDAWRQAIDDLRPGDVATRASGRNNWSMPWPRASTSSWKSPSRPIRRRSGG
jgi:threonine dehydrogenase-like Zn-dependent dehydrogenase